MITILGYWMAAALLVWAIGNTIVIVWWLVSHYYKGKR